MEFHAKKNNSVLYALKAFKIYHSTNSSMLQYSNPILVIKTSNKIVFSFFPFINLNRSKGKVIFAVYSLFTVTDAWSLFIMNI